MMNWFAVCIFAFVTLCPDAYANIGDDMAITVKICCNEGHQFAQEHDSCDELLCEPPKSSLVLTLMCSMAQQECCTDYIQKKTECEEGIYTSISIYNCASRKNTRQVCCQECIRGTSLGASKGPTACQKQPKGTTAEDILSNDAFVKCCEIAAEDWKDTTSQRNSKDVTTSTLPSMCEKNAPNKLCAHHCIPIPGSYKCECNRGFMLMDDGRNCMEVTKNSCNNCQHKCNDNGVEVKCYCNQGYELMPDEKSCQDIDECQLEKTKCPLDAKCHNFLGSYACIPVNKNVDYNNRGHQCPSGYIWINENNACEDIDECALGTYHCGANYSCYNMKGTYRCDQPAIIVIKQFFDFKAENETSSNKSPKEITTTSTSKPNGGVSRNSSSVRTLEEEASNKNVGNNAEPSEETPKPHKPLPRLPPSGSTDPKVLATEPSRTEGVLPQDTESAPTQSPTDLHSRVTTIKPSPKPPVDANNSTIFNEKDKTSKNSTNPRDCLAGFALDEYGACFDIDECATNNHTCSALTETCINTPGGFTCNCTTGFERDSITKSCIDSNECETEEAKCGPLQICTNLAGSYTCSCPSGYKLIADRECEDIDECETGEANCGPQQICTNMAGGYKCTCPSGYKLMADHECEDINECEIETEYLHLYICYGSLQASNKCMASRAGSLCQHRCKNVWGGYRCSCHRGYRLKNDNRTCSDIDECDEFKSKFLCISQCVNEVGSYHCTCPSGYTLSPDKKSCIDIDECATGEALCSNATASSTSNLICINVRGSYKCHRISCPAGYKLENQHRCTKVKKTCPLSDWTCQHQPTTISYNFITFVSNLYIPESQGLRTRNSIGEQQCFPFRCTKVKKTCPLSDWTCQHQPTTISYNFITFVSNLYIPESQPMCYLGMASYVCCRNGGALRCWLAGYGCTQSYSECPAPLGYPPGPTTYFSLKLFTMRLPTWPNAKSSFQLRLVNVSGPPSVRNKADIYNFLITVPIQSEAVLSLIRPLEGPQTIELEISMEVYTDEQYGGTAVAKVFIYVSEYEF